MYTFGCVCFVHLSSHQCNKLSAQSVRCAFMGYIISIKGYVCYDPCSNRFRISLDVVLFENQHFFSAQVVSVPEISILPYFDDLSSTPDGQSLNLCMNDDAQLCLFLSRLRWCLPWLSWIVALFLGHSTTLSPFWLIWIFPYILSFYFVIYSNSYMLFWGS